MADHYKRISRSYNWLSKVYSLGAVERCRRFALTQLETEMRVCYLGVGAGEEAIESLRMGAWVTVVDSSEAMLERFQNKLLELGSTERARCSVFHGDVHDFCDERGAEFDQVVCHFFLNVFGSEEMPLVLERVSGLMAPGACLVIGDFWYDQSAAFYVRLMQRVYWNLALFIFTKIVKNAKHPIYVYDDLLEGLGLKITQQQIYRVIGIPMYRSVVAYTDKTDKHGSRK